MSGTEARSRASETLLHIASLMWPEVESEKGENALHHWYALRFAASWYRTNKAGSLPDTDAEEMRQALEFMHRFVHGNEAATPPAQGCHCPVASLLMKLTGFLIICGAEEFAHVEAL